MIFVFAVLFSAFFLYCWSESSSNKNAPPGPLALPIIGHMHLIGSKALHIICANLSKQYGDIFTLQLASRKAVILCSREVIVDAFVKNSKCFAGRPDLPTFRKTRNGKVGLSLCDYSERYLENRKLTIRAFHSFLADKNNFQEKLREEAQKMLRLFDSYAVEGKRFFPINEFNKIIPSTFLKLMFGICVDYNDQSFRDIVEAYKNWFKVAEADNPADFMPFLEKFPNRRLEIVEECGHIFDAFVEKHFESRHPGSMLNEFIMNVSNGNDDEKLSEEVKKEIGKVVADVIGGGFDTAVSVVAWGILYFKNNPRILRKCRDEIDSIVQTRVISIEHKSDLPYLYATIYEIIRLSSVAPMGLVRKALTDVTVGGFTIEKDTIVMPHLWLANHDASFWDHHDQMDPERFLKTIDNHVNVDRHAINDVLSFSIGARRCPGEQFAFSMLFVLFGTLIKNYELNMRQPPSDMLPLRGITLKPKYFEISLSSRE